MRPRPTPPPWTISRAHLDILVEAKKTYTGTIHQQAACRNTPAPPQGVSPQGVLRKGFGGMGPRNGRRNGRRIRTGRELSGSPHSMSPPHSTDGHHRPPARTAYGPRREGRLANACNGSMEGKVGSNHGRLPHSHGNRSQSPRRSRDARANRIRESGIRRQRGGEPARVPRPYPLACAIRGRAGARTSARGASTRLPTI